MVFVPLSELRDLLSKTGKYWIVYTGDSITSCENVFPNWRDMVVYVLQSELTELMNGDWKTPEWGIKSFNFAYDGSTTKDIVDKLDDILLVKPSLLIGLMGGNDPTLGVSIEKSAENINLIVDRAIKSATKVVWCNSTPAGESSKKNIEYKPYAEAFMKIPEQEGFFKVDMFNIYQQFETKRFFTFISEENPAEGIKAGETDLQHPNQLGNAYIAKVVLKQVFDLEFDPEKYIEDTLKGEKYPGY